MRVQAEDLEKCKSDPYAIQQTGAVSVQQVGVPTEYPQCKQNSQQAAFNVEPEAPYL